ncbi:MAG: NAD-dependent epimerase/dehydratase family protein [Planctomycetota bacterium]
MSILVTGGAGFVGSHLMDRLAEEGRAAVCLDNFDDFYAPETKRNNIRGAASREHIEVVEGDIRDADLCRRVFEQYDVRQVVHLAARAGVRPSIDDPSVYEDVNCGGTMNLLNEAARADVDSFIFGSSSSVYGGNTEIPFSEEHAVGRPISPYAATKRSGELFCHTFHHLYDIPTVCLRFFTVYGPRQRPDLAIYKFTDLIHRGEPIPLYGDGSSRRDYTYCADVVDGIMAALERQFDYEIINIGNSRPVQLTELVRLIEEAMGTRAEKNWLPEQPGDMPVTYADISRAEKLLDYDPQYPIERGIEDFVQWYQNSAIKRAH